MVKKKVFSIISKVITALIILFTVCTVIFTVISVNTLNKKNKSIFGFQAYIVLSDSMKAEFRAGDIVVSKAVKKAEDASDLAAGKIITFLSANPDNYGETITHKIFEKTTVDGKIAYITYGTTTGEKDEYPVYAEQIIGIYSFHLPKLGYFFNFLKTPAGYVTVILTPFLLLILFNGAHFVRLIKAYAGEKKRDEEEARAKAESEREESRRLKDELEQLKAQLAEVKQSGENSEKAPDDSEAPKDE